MSLRNQIAALAQTGSSPLLNGNCKLEWGGSEIYGEEAIAELFRASPMAGSSDELFLEAGQHAAWIAGPSALFADLYDGRIARLWRVGPGGPPPGEPALLVAFDPDLRQQRGSVYLRGADHPLLAEQHLALLEQAGVDLLAAPAATPTHRARAFLIRAFSAGQGAAGLFAVHRLTGGEVRSSSVTFALVARGTEGASSIVDEDAPTRWLHRF